MDLPVSNHWTGICRSRTQLILPHTEFCPGQSKTSSSLGHLPRRAGEAHAPGECSCRELPGFPRLAETEYAFLVGEWDTAVSPDISQALFSLPAQCVVIQAHGSQGTCLYWGVRSRMDCSHSCQCFPYSFLKCNKAVSRTCDILTGCFPVVFLDKGG